MKLDTRYQRKRHLSITFSSVSILKSLYWTIFLSTCFLTCLFLWMARFDNETSIMAMTVPTISQRRGQLAGAGAPLTYNVNGLNWHNDGEGAAGPVTGAGETTSSADTGDFVTDFDVSVGVDVDNDQTDPEIAVITADLEPNRRYNQVGVLKTALETTGKANEAKGQSIATHHSDANEKIRQAQDHYVERFNLVQSYCQSNPVFNIGRHHLTMEMLHLLNGKTNLWMRAMWMSSSASQFSPTTNPDRPIENSRSASGFQRQVILEWCPVFKSASTPWMALLMKLKNHLYPRIESMIESGNLTFVKLARIFRMQIQKSSRSLFLSTTAQLQTSNSSILNISMLIVRHPFERLLSAYRDKLERIQGRQYYHRKYGIAIVRKFRYHQQMPFKMGMHRRLGRSAIASMMSARKPTASMSTTTKTTDAADLNSRFQTWQKSFAVPLLTMRMDQNYKERRFIDPLEDDDYDDDNDDVVANLDDNIPNTISVDKNSLTGSGNRNRLASFTFNRFQRAPGLKDNNLDFPELIPTFNEFVQYLLQLSPLAMDEHWRPVFVDCNACNGQLNRGSGNLSSPFNLILKVETMDEDRDFLLNLLGVNSTMKSELDLVWKRWTNPSGSGSSGPLLKNGGRKDSHGKTLHKYFSQVSKRDLKALYSIYEPDFDMFGYSATEYIAMGK